MTILAEIADKVPTTGGIVAVGLVAALVCGAVAAINRVVGVVTLALTLVGGGSVACANAGDAFISDPMRDAVWAELGWPWVLADIGSPLVPALAVAGVLFVQRSRARRRGFPVDATAVNSK